MTDEQAGRLRVLMQEALELVLERPIAFVLVAQDEDRNIEIVTNAAHREQLPDLLLEAAKIVRTPPDAHTTIHDHRAAGESAVAHGATGMECGHAAPPGDSIQGPAAVAVSEDCMWVPKWPEDATRCPNKATGVIRLKLFPAPAIQKRYGKRVMLAMVMGLHVCQACFPALSIMKVADEKLRTALGKLAQQRNNGILVDWSQTEIERVTYDDKEWLMLAKSLSAKESQPAPAGPQPEGVGDGPGIG